MNLAITASGDRLDSDIDPRFGRCKYFIFVNPDTMAFKPCQIPARQVGPALPPARP